MKACFDQENLNKKLGEWEAGRLDDNFVFRPFTEDVRNASVNDAGDLQVLGDEETGLLLVHQTNWQRRLLEKYGQLCLLDAVYKTTRYALPVFYLCVRTNVDYIVVATFVLQYEDFVSISEALGFLKSWNPNWTPRHFLVDGCESEMKALQTVFVG
jgi:MULE transposase domain